MDIRGNEGKEGTFLTSHLMRDHLFWKLELSSQACSCNIMSRKVLDAGILFDAPAHSCWASQEYFKLPAQYLRRDTSVHWPHVFNQVGFWVWASKKIPGLGSASSRSWLMGPWQLFKHGQDSPAWFGSAAYCLNVYHYKKRTLTRACCDKSCCPIPCWGAWVLF